MELRESWQRIVAWCQAHAPETARAIRPPAGADAIEQAQAATSGSWPPDLREWYMLMDGTERTPAGHLVPGYCPLPLDSVTEHWTMWQEIRAQIAAESQRQDPYRDRLLRTLSMGNQERYERARRDPYDLTHHEGQPAGTAAGIFLPSFVPIAEDQSGSDMFVDTREGASRGCVIEFVKGEGDRFGPQWPSVTAMLADVADALSTGRPVHHRLPVVVNGSLDWDFAPG